MISISTRYARTEWLALVFGHTARLIVPWRPKSKGKLPGTRIGFGSFHCQRPPHHLLALATLTRAHGEVHVDVITS